MDIEILFKTHYARLCNVAYRIVNDKDVAEDIVQELFLKIWHKRAQIEFNSTAEGYLVRATSNMALDHLKKNKKFLFVNHETHLTKVREAVGADQKINYEELRVIVYKALDKLPPKCRAIFILCRFEGMKYKEIAQQLNISVKTVENQMSIAIFKLKGDLKETLKDDYISLLYVLMFIEVNYKIITQFF